MKVIAGRSDGFIVEQDAADKYIRAHRKKISGGPFMRPGIHP
jgi:hypothetical protein